MIKLNGREVAFEEFPNKETRLLHDNLKIDYPVSEVHFKYENDSDLIKLMLLKNYLDDVKVECVTLIIYYMPYSRMDRSEEGSPFTLKYISKFINSLNFYDVTIVEAHSNVSTALLDRANNYLVNEDLIGFVLKDIDFNIETDYIMYPDAGASSRYKNFTYPNVIIGNKKRDFATGQIQGLQLIGDFNKGGKKVLIADDLSSYGNTFVHSAKALREQGIEEVYLLVAHAENSIFKGELFNHIDKLFTTDSILTEQSNWENKKYEKQLQIFNLEEVIKTKQLGGF